MRLVALLLLVVLAGCVANTSAPVPRSWSPEEAAVITYDQGTDTFTLTNVSDQRIYFDGRSETRPSVSYQRLSPDGWMTTASDWCGTDRDWYPLDPGKRLSLGKFDHGIGLVTMEVRKFVVENQDLDVFPARVGLAIRCDGSARETVYSAGVILPKQN